MKKQWLTLLLVGLLGHSNIVLSQYLFTDLGDLPGGSNSSLANGINNSGIVTGIGRTNVGNRGFAWLDGFMLDIGAFQGGNNTSSAFDINDSGQIVGTSNQTTNHGFIWDSGIMTMLPGLPGGNNRSEAEAINNSGQIAGFSVTFGNSTQAVMWDSGTVTELSNLGGSFSQAFDINDSAKVVGTRSAGISIPSLAFLWDAGQVTHLGDFAGGQHTSRANGINNLDQIVGWGSSSTGTRAALWQNDTMTNLGDLPGGFDASEAFDINDSGQVVGLSYASNGKNAFIWDQVNGMQNLNDLLVPGEGIGWTLTEAKSINNSGQIVGRATFLDGTTHGFLLTPIPEPMTIGLLGLGAMTLIQRRRNINK